MRHKIVPNLILGEVRTQVACCAQEDIPSEHLDIQQPLLVGSVMSCSLREDRIALQKTPRESVSAYMRSKHVPKYSSVRIRKILTVQRRSTLICDIDIEKKMGQIAGYSVAPIISLLFSTHIYSIKVPSDKLRFHYVPLGSSSRKSYNRGCEASIASELYTYKYTGQ